MAVDSLAAARPYAVAAHRHAAAAGGEAPQLWQDMLDSLAGVVADASVSAMLDDPRISPAKKRDAVEGLLGQVLGEGGSEAGGFANLVMQLYKNGRLEAAPELARLYRDLRREAEGVLEAEIRTAFEIGDDKVAQISERLKERFKAREVKTTVTVDPELGGGLMIIAGDDVIDGSVRASLAQLHASLRRA